MDKLNGSSRLSKVIDPTISFYDTATHFSTNSNDMPNISVTVSDNGPFGNSTQDFLWSSGNFTAEEYLQGLNDEFARLVLPAIIVLGILMVLGAIGNSFVLYVYTFKMKGGTITRFIQALAVFDLLSCCVAIPGEIIDMRSNYTFGNHSMCKIVRTVNLFCTVASGCSLVVVAIDRYKRICCPLKRQIAPRGALIIMCCCTVTSLVISLPTAAIYGSRTISTSVISINGSDCSTSDHFINTMFPLAYNGLQMLLFFVGAIILMVLYTLIARRIFHHAHLRQKRRSSVNIGRLKYSRETPSFLSYPTSSSEHNSPITSDILSTEAGKKPMKSDSKSQQESNLKTCTESIQVNRCSNNDNEKDENCHQTQIISKEVDSNGHGPCRELKTNGTEMELEIVDGLLAWKKEIPEVDNLMDTESNTETSVSGEPVPFAELTNVIQTPIRDTSDSSKVTESSIKETNTFKENSDLTHSDAQDTKKSNGITHSPASTVSDSTVGAESPKFSVTCTDSDDNTGLNCTTCETETESYSSDHSLTASPPETPIDDLDNPERGLLTSYMNKTRCVTSARKCHVNSSPFRNGKQVKHKGCSSLKCAKVSLQPVQENDTKCSENGSIVSELDENQNKDSALKSRCDQPKKLSDSSDCNLQMRRRERTGEGDSARLTRHSFAIGSSSNSEKSRKRVLFTNSSFGYGDKKENFNNRKNKDRDTQGTEADDEEEETLRRRKKRRSSLRGLKDLKNLALRSDAPGTRRTTLMLFLITLVYILSFLPHLVLMTIKALDENSLSGYGGSWELANNLLIRSYFINSVANPIIYGFFSKNFFRECKNCLKCSSST